MSRIEGEGRRAGRRGAGRVGSACSGPPRGLPLLARGLVPPAPVDGGRSVQRASCPQKGCSAAWTGQVDRGQIGPREA